MITCKDVRVDYDDVTAVSDLTLDIQPGEVFGLIGPNGAGKTSTIRVLATLQVPTYGEVRIGGYDALEEPGAVHRILGYMPDMSPVYDDLRCWEFLDLYGASYFVNRRVRRRRIEQCLELVNLTGKRNMMAGTLSRGMTQRLVLAKTLLPDPDVMLLDEPASGLDPVARVDLRKMLVELAARGKTILISSHILTELSEFCTSIGIMETGRLVLAGSIDDIISGMRQKERLFILSVTEVVGAMDRVLEEDSNVLRCEGDGLARNIAFVGDDQAATSLLAQLVKHDVPVLGFAERKIGVEDIVLQVGAREVS